MAHFAEMQNSVSPAITLRQIYVVDDDSMVRRALSFALRTAGFDVRPFGSARDFIDDILWLKPGCVLLDLRMPELDGFAVLAALNARNSELPVVVMTGHGDVVSAVKSMKLGARDFIEKPFSDDMLLETIEAAFAGLPRGAVSPNAQATAASRLNSLTAREYEVLRALVGGLPNKAIANRLDLSVRTVEMHRANMMNRLNLPSLAEVLQLAFTAKVELLD